MAVQPSLLLLSSVICRYLETVGANVVEAVATTTTPEVPTFFHYSEYDNYICNGNAYTDNPTLGCNGWSNVDEFDCKKKCFRHESVGNCPAKKCFALAYYPNGRVCQLYERSQCRELAPKNLVMSFRKEVGDDPGLPGKKVPEHGGQVNAGALALAAAAGLVAASEVTQGGGSHATTSQVPKDLAALLAGINEAEMVGAKADALDILAAKRAVMQDHRSIEMSAEAQQAIDLEEDEILAMSRAQQAEAEGDHQDARQARREIRLDAEKLNDLMAHSARAEKAVFEFSEEILDKVPATTPQAGAMQQQPTQAPPGVKTLTGAVNAAEKVGAKADEMDIVAARAAVLQRDKGIQKSAAAEDAVALVEDQILAMQRAQKPGASQQTARQQVRQDSAQLNKLLQKSPEADKAVFEFSEEVLHKVAPGLVALPSTTGPTTAPSTGASSFDAGLAMQLLVLMCGLCCVATVCQALSKKKKRARYQNVDDYERGHHSDHGLSDYGSDVPQD